jgi:feruloyl esterase
MRILRPLWYVALAACELHMPVLDAPIRCSSFSEFSSLKTNVTSIISTEHYDVGQKNISGATNQVTFCEVSARVKYSRHSSLTFAVWLPDTEYSSRFMAIGNGGQAGEINFADMMAELNSGLGFAVAGGDAGHLFADNDVGMGGTLGKPGAYQPYLHNEDEIKAWLHNAINLFTSAARALIEEFYGQEAQYSYFRGCSAGGAQGFSLAEFYPDQFDGIIAGCPANWFTRLMLSFLWNQKQFQVSPSFHVFGKLAHQG